MNKIKSLIILGLCSIIFHNCYTSNSNQISNKETFATTEEKIKLYRSLGLEYIHEVTVSPELRRHLIQLALTDIAQNTFAQNDYYQECTVRDLTTYQTIAQDRSATNNMIIKKINPIVGYGIIAGKKFKRGDCLGLYAGELKLKSNSIDNEDYAFACDSITPGCPDLIVDAQHKGNELRFINGSQHHSNCEARNFLVRTGEKRLIYQATQDIESGQEILADYGDNYWSSYRRNIYQELGTTKSQQQAKSELTLGNGFKKGFLK